MTSLNARSSGFVAAPSADAHSAAPMDLIFIEGFRGQTVIGIHHSELHDPQPVVIDLHAGVPRARACDTDRIADTIDYAEVRLRLRPVAQLRRRLARQHPQRR